MPDNPNVAVMRMSDGLIFVIVTLVPGVSVLRMQISPEGEVLDALHMHCV